MNFIVPYIGNVIIPTDFHSIIFQRGRAQPPTSISPINILYNVGGPSDVSWLTKALVTSSLTKTIVIGVV